MKTEWVWAQARAGRIPMFASAGTGVFGRPPSRRGCVISRPAARRLPRLPCVLCPSAGARNSPGRRGRSAHRRADGGGVVVDADRRGPAARPATCIGVKSPVCRSRDAHGRQEIDGQLMARRDARCYRNAAKGPISRSFAKVSDGTRTHDRLDHNHGRTARPRGRAPTGHSRPESADDHHPPVSAVSDAAAAPRLEAAEARGGPRLRRPSGFARRATANHERRARPRG